MKRTSIYIIFVVFIIVLILLIFASLNPLRYSLKYIKDYVIESIPLGTDIESAVRIMENNKWEIVYINDKHGYSVDADGRPGIYSNSVCIGKKSIRAYLGSYRNIFETDVTAYFGFDENSKLIDIAIRKDTDAL